MPIRLAIVDTHTLTRYGLRELVSRQPDMQITAEYASAARAAAAIAAADVDVVTVNATLPDGDGLRLTQLLRERSGDLGIVVLTARPDDELLFRALTAGASAFVARDAPVAEVLTAIRHAAVAASSFTASGLALALDRRRMVEQRLALSARETEVLGLLRDGLSTPAIATAMFLSHSTVRTYVARLYEKLGVTNRAQAIMTAMHYGLISYEEAGRTGRPASPARPPDPAPVRHRARPPSPGNPAIAHSMGG